MTTPRQIATVSSVAELMQVLRERAAELGATRETIDAAAGLTDGHASKILAPIPIKAIGPKSMFPLIRALGMVMVLLEDAEGMQRLAESAVRPLSPRQRGEVVQEGDTYAKVLRRMERKIIERLSKRGAARSNEIQRQNPERLARRNRRVARARQRRVREARAAARRQPDPETLTGEA